MLVRDFQYAFQEFYNNQREYTASDKLKKSLWQFKYVINPRKDVRPTELKPGDTATNHFVPLPVDKNKVLQ